jgi:DNA-binding IclR family transcriptional regulator
MIKNDDTQPHSLARALALLDLFDAARPTWTVEALCEASGWSVPTGYRYVRDLLAAGLLRRLPGGLYALGPRITLLDYVMRQADPALRLAVPEMRELVRRTGCDCVTTSLFGDTILDTHRESGAEPLPLTYGRGRPRPPFRGAAPKVILAAQPTAWLHKFHDSHAEEARADGMGADWKSFRSAIAEIRRRGHYVSRGELEAGLCGVAVALPPAEPGSGTAIALVAERDRFALLNEALVIAMLHQAAERIGAAAQAVRGA